MDETQLETVHDERSQLMQSSRMGSRRWEYWHTISDVWKNVVEVIAILIGGLWVLITFGLQSCPAREKQFVWESELGWRDGPSPNTCIATWHINLKNISTRSIDVRRVDVRLWTYSLPTPTGTRPAYVDSEQQRPKKLNDYFYRREFTDPDDPLVDEYAPNGVSESEYEWIIPKPSTPTWLTLEVELYEDKAGAHSLWFGSSESQLCPPSSEKD